MTNKREAIIETLSTQGEGIARLDGKVIFVPFTLENETWEIEPFQDKKNYSRAWPLQLNSEKHPSRVQPRCPYFTHCGGCQIQHMGEEKQRESKRLWLQETFRRIAHLNTNVNPLVFSYPWEYRNKIRLLLLNEENMIQFAFHFYGKPEQKVPIQDCPIAHEAIRNSIPTIYKILNTNWSQETRKIPENAKVILHVELQTRVILTFENVVPPKNVLEVLENEGFKTNIVKKHKSHTLTTDHDPTAFRQVNDRVQDRLYDYVKQLPYLSTESLLEGYCGPGILTSLLGQRFSNIIAVEANSSNVGQAKHRVSRQRHIRIHSMTMETFLRKNRDSYRTILLNPPRSGLSTTVRKQISKLGANDLVMLSCHPAALARDTAAFVKAGFTIQQLQPFDMFPQTYHVEAVIHLQRS